MDSCFNIDKQIISLDNIVVCQIFQDPELLFDGFLEVCVSSPHYFYCEI